MNYLDIHSHILPNVDDGAKDIETSVALLQMLKEQGVTHVIATPHFYPDTDSAEDFAEQVEPAYSQLKKATWGTDLPQVYLGCELHYFGGISKSKSITQFAIRGTKYILLELQYDTPITKTILQDITDIYENTGLIPILAHIERYTKLRGYKKLLKLISDGTVLAQSNAESLLLRDYCKPTEKLIKGGYVSFLASDAHSLHRRPPYIDKALKAIEEKLGRSVATRLIIKSNKLLEEIEEQNAQYQFDR